MSWATRWSHSHYKVPVRRDHAVHLRRALPRSSLTRPAPTAEFFIAIAGPIVSLTLAVIFMLLEHPVGGIAPLLRRCQVSCLHQFCPRRVQSDSRLFRWTAAASFVRRIVWGTIHDLHRATLIAANVGRFFGFAFIMWASGIFSAGISVAACGSPSSDGSWRMPHQPRSIR